MAAYRAYQSDPLSTLTQIAIFLDNDVLAAPVVTGGGQTDQTEITGSFDVEQATTLANLIGLGPLPIGLAIVSINVSPATDSIISHRQGRNVSKASLNNANRSQVLEASSFDEALTARAP